MPFSVTDHPSFATGLRWLYVDFNSYFASVEQQLNPDLRGLPVMVVPVESDATCAIAASYEAKAFGIKTGTPVYEAKRLCPEVVCVLARHEHYVDFHARICDEVDKHIPITQVCSIDEVACRLMDNETSIERVSAIAAAIKAGLRAHIGEAVRCSIGVAANKYLAKVATDLHKPDGFTILHPAEVEARLRPLPLRDLPGIGRNMELRLQAAGIDTMAQLWALDAKQMRKVWGGVWGERMWYYLRGAELPEMETTRASVGHSHVMAPALRDPAQAKFVARRLAIKAASRLRRMGYYARAMQLSARTEQGGRVRAECHFERMQDTAGLLAQLELLWREAMAQGRGARLKKVSVTLSGLVAADALQPELFDRLPDSHAQRRERAERASRAMDAINHRFGRDSVLQGMLPSQGKSFSGTKVAFTRIPDVEEFLE